MSTPKKIWKKDAAEELGISLASLDRIVKVGELHYANWNAPLGSHRYFYQSDLENYKVQKTLEDRRTADIVTKILKNDPFTAYRVAEILEGTSLGEVSLLNEFISSYLRQLPLDIVLEIVTTPPRSDSPINYYRSKFPLFQRKIASPETELQPETHTAAVLALDYLISKVGGVCKLKDFQAPGTVSYSRTSDTNTTLRDFRDDILECILTYANAWFADKGAFKRAQESNILHFLAGSGCGYGSPQKCIVLDETTLYVNMADNHQNGTKVIAYLTVPLP